MEFSNWSVHPAIPRRSGSYSASELRTQQMSIRRDSQSDGRISVVLRVRIPFNDEKMPHRRILTHHEQLPEFERVRTI
ncbi:hypothetical protein TNCV_1542701 [Trichonephila clavipes]|nr:hypothetical protein TNCV_1542701 [Trichonephila clavipes]